MASLSRCDTPQSLDLPRLEPTEPLERASRRRHHRGQWTAARRAYDHRLGRAAAIVAECARSRDARIKADHTPVTAADEVAEALILEALGRLLPGVCVVSEEAAGRACPD